LQAVQSASIRKSFFHRTAYEGMGDDLILTTNMLCPGDATFTKWRGYQCRARPGPSDVVLPYYIPETALLSLD
jgi:hypothetical protein